jgi:hypothetical protein
MTAAAPRPTATMRWMHRLAAAIGLALALGFAYGAAVRSEDDRRMQEVGVPSVGVVVGREEVRRTGRDGRLLAERFRATLRFALQEGGEAEAVPPEWLTEAETRNGRRHALVYDPEDPREVRLARSLGAESAMQVWGLALVAALLLVGSLLVLAWTFRRPATAAPAPGSPPAAPPSAG